MTILFPSPVKDSIYVPPVTRKELFYSESKWHKIFTLSFLTGSSSGDFVRFNPHFHTLLIEGGFDPEETTKILRHLIRIGRPPPNFTILGVCSKLLI